MAVHYLVRMERDIEVSGLKKMCVYYVIERRRRAVINSTLLRLAKDMGKLTKVLPVLAVGRVVGKKRVGHMIRFETYRRVIIDTPLVLELAGPRVRLNKRRQQKIRETDP